MNNCVDAAGKPVQIGDKVTIECEVTGIHPMLNAEDQIEGHALNLRATGPNGPVHLGTLNARFLKKK